MRINFITLKNSFSSQRSLDLYLGLVIVITIFSVLEYNTPLFFTQDDNYSQFLPVITNFIQYKYFSGWSPQLYGGAPILESGTYAHLYPVTWLSYYLSQLLTNSGWYTIDLFVFIHVFLGYIFFYLLLCKLELQRVYRVILPLTFVLCGFVLIVGRSWYYMVPPILFLPLVFWCLYQSDNNSIPSIKKQIFLGAIIGIWYYAGNGQMWIYGCLFIAFYILLAIIQHKKPIQFSLSFLYSLWISLTIVIPTAIPQLSISSELVGRVGGFGEGISSGLKSVFIPWPLVNSFHPNGWNGDYGGSMGQMFYASSIGAICWALLLITAIKKRPSLHQLSWGVLGLIAFTLALGKEGIIWTLMRDISIFSLFNHPFKFLIFFHFFSIVSAAIFISQRKFFSNKTVSCIITATIITLTCINVFTAKSAFMNFKEPAYPPIPAEIKEILASGKRFVPVTHYRSSHSNYTFSMAHNWALTETSNVLLSLSGYDPLIEERYWYMSSQVKFRDNPIEYISAYSVDRIIFFDDEIEDNSIMHELKRWPLDKLAPNLLSPERMIYSKNGIKIYENPSQPLAYLRKQQEIIEKKVTLRSQSIEVDLQGEGGTYVMAWRRSPGIIAHVDGKKVNVYDDDFWRIVVDVPSGREKLLITYENPWQRDGLLLSGITFIVGLLALIVNLSMRKRVIISN